MNFFSAALTEAMERRGFRQVNLANAAGVDQPRISRYLSADSSPDEPTLKKLCGALPDSETALVVAYVRDLIPKFGRDLVRVTGVESSTAVAETPPLPAIYLSISGPWKKLLDELITKSESKPELFHALDSMLDLTRRG
jgi:transcriptional regulator with XRE-family HTH domain